MGVQVDNPCSIRQKLMRIIDVTKDYAGRYYCELPTLHGRTKLA